jgi:chemotaxis protein MotB
MTMAAERDAKPRKAQSRKKPPSAGGWQRLSASLLVYRGGRADSTQAWLLTFTDLSALMLTFFVLLFSMSSIDEARWQNLIDAFSPQMTGLQEVTVALPTADATADAVERVPGRDLDYLAAVLREQMAASATLADARIERAGDRLVVSLPGDLLFAPGAARLAAPGEQAIHALSSVLRNLRNVIEVAGHADPTQPQARYPSNWELSLMRAAAVSDQLSELGYRGGIVVRGYGDGRYGEIDPALDGDQRLARARRVDIVIHDYAAEAR